MDSIEVALAKWTALYEQFQQARARLRQALERRGPVPSGLREEVDDCERKCVAALSELNAAYAKAKGTPPA